MKTDKVIRKTLELARHQLQAYTKKRCPFECRYCGDGEVTMNKYMIYHTISGNHPVWLRDWTKTGYCWDMRYADKYELDEALDIAFELHKLGIETNLKSVNGLTDIPARFIEKGVIT